MPPAITLILALPTLLLCSRFSPAASGDVGGGGARRVLHQPLFPIEWTPPPPAPDFTSHHSPPATPDGRPGDFFPPAPPTPAGGGGTMSSPTTVAADVSNTPSGPAAGRHGGGPAKATIVAAGAAAAAAVALLGFACAFLINGRARRRGDSQKLLGSDCGQAHHGGGPSATDFLYVGTVEPTTPAHQHHGPTTADLFGSPYRKLRSERARRGVSRDEATDHPSPELRPLPPLRRATTLGSSDEDAYYTPQQRSGGFGGGAGGEAWSEASASSPPTTTTASRRSLPSLTSDLFPPVEAIAAPPPPPVRSRRTPPSTRFSTGSTPDIKQVISPSPRPVQPSNPPPPPPPPPPPTAKSNTAPKPPPPPPPMPSSNNLPKPAEPPSGPTSRRRLLKPLPPEGPRIAMPMPITAATTVDNNGSTSMRAGHDSADGHLGSGEPRPKLKPLHWDKVRATSDRAMVWDQLKSSSFQLDEDMIEALFMNNSTPAARPREVGRKAGVPPFRQEERVLDPKKAQNIAILLRALNVTREEVSDALLDGNDECLGTELLETLVKMAPTKEEELKLRDYSGDLSKLGSAECFLKAVLDIPFAFKRVDAMLYRANFETEINYLRKSFETLEAACEDLRGSRLFLKLLEAVLRTGNRMNVGTNRGEAKAFKLDTLLKLADVKGADGKTTLLHFVVQEIIRSEDAKSEKESAKITSSKDEQFRKQGLKVVSGLSSELGNVKKAATMDFDVLHGYVNKLETGLEKIKSVLQLERQCTQGQRFFMTMQGFLKEAEKEIERVRGEEKRALGRVKDITEYFHGDAAKEEAHPLRIFMVVRDFLSTLDDVCKEVGRMQQDRTVIGSARSFRISATTSLPVVSLYCQRRESNSDDDSSSS